MSLCLNQWSVECGQSDGFSFIFAIMCFESSLATSKTMCFQATLALVKKKRIPTYCCFSSL
jgi:hypothetical protein